MTMRSYLSWQKYWDFEPWGAWRDNLHAAILAREIRRPHLRRGSKIGIEPFMVKSPSTRRKESEQNLFTVLQTMAKGVSPAEAEKRRRKRKRKSKK